MRHLSGLDHETNRGKEPAVVKQSIGPRYRGRGSGTVDSVILKPAQEARRNPVVTNKTIRRMV
jgi:hypothetical protein